MDDNNDKKLSCDANEDEINDSRDKSEQNVETQQSFDKQESSSSSWWGNWIQTAKSKSNEAYEFLKKDLTELRETVQNDTAVVVSNTASYVSQTMKDTITGISNTVAPLYEDDVESDDDKKQTKCVEKQTSSSSDSNERLERDVKASDEHSSDDWTINLTNRAKQKLNSLIGSIADAFVINRNYFEDEDEMYVLSGDKLVAIDKWKSLLSEIQSDPNTYCREPSGPPEHYESWLMTFNLIDYQRQMEHLLSTEPKMKEFYEQLVPSSLSDVDFWHRYYYRVHQIREIERNKIEDKVNDKDIATEDTNVSQNNKKVEIKLLEENIFTKNDSKQQLIGIESDITPVNEDSTSSPNSSDTRQSEAGSEDWEKTDFNDIGEESKNFNEKSYASDEDIKDWVKYE